jgi:hypothetical protein
MVGLAAAIRYTCGCGIEYLIVIQGDAGADWLETIQQVGRALEVEVIDGETLSFVCTGCGEAHRRETVPEPARSSTTPGLVGTLFSQATRAEFS